MNKSIRWTAQIWINGYSQPRGDDVLFSSSLEAIGSLLADQVEEAQRYGAGYPSDDLPGGGEALVWAGPVEDVTDVYPGKAAKIGPRGGIRFVDC